MTESIQRDTVPALRKNEKSKSCISKINLSKRHFECFVSGRLNCDGSCMLRGIGAVLDGTKQIGICLFQKRTSDVLLQESVDFFVPKSRLRRPRSLPVLLTHQFLLHRSAEDNLSLADL